LALLKSIDLSRKCKSLLLFLLVVFAFESTVAGGLPIFYYLDAFSTEVDYTSYGVKSLHGVFNAGCFIYFILNLNCTQRNYLRISIPLILFLLTYSRGWLFICIGYFFIYKLITLRSTFIKRSNAPSIVLYISLVVLSGFLFGVIGQYRVFLPFDQPYWSTQVHLPFVQSLLEWPYVYLVGSTANSLNIVEHVHPLPDLLPEWFISKFVPSSLSSLIGVIKAPDVYSYETYRIHELVTTASIHADIYIVAGFLGCLMFFSIFWFSLSCILKYACYDKRFLIILPYAILQAYLFPFSNIVLNLPFMLPYLVIFAVFKKSDFNSSM
jgi:hypothetical protein